LGEVGGAAQAGQLRVASPFPFPAGDHLDDVDGRQAGRVGAGELVEAFDHAGQAHFLERVRN